MFSTLLGALPLQPDPDAAAPDEAPRDPMAALEATGLELLSTGRPAAGGPTPDVAAIVDAWRAAAAATSRPVKAVLAGPYSAGRSAAPTAPIDLAEALGPVISALAAAGCPLIEIDEPDALPIADDDRERRRFGDAHRRLLELAGDLEGLHLSLALTGGNLDPAGPATFFDLAYASYAFDLIGGPDNWRLIAAAPTDRGIVCGALGLEPGGDETPEVLVWAAHYAASTAGRGLARVGLANAPLRAGQSIGRAEALRKLAIVADAGRIAAVESTDEMAGLLDRRVIGHRPASFGRFAPGRRRRP